MSLFSGAKNNKFFYPPIVKIKKNNHHLSDIYNSKHTKNKKNNNLSLKSTNQIIKSNSYSNMINGNKKIDFYIKEQNNDSLLLNLKNRSNSKNDKNKKYIDSESIYEKNIQLKTEINQIKKELVQMKAENQRKEKEIQKRDKLLVTAFDKKTKGEVDFDSMFIINDKKNNENNYLENDIKKNNYMSKFRKQYMELKKKYEEKISEINLLKKNIKITKLNELAIQNKEILKELNKLKDTYITLFQENQKNIEKIKKLKELENEINDKNLIILQLQESLKISSATNIKYENEFEEMKITINNLQNENKNLLEKIKKLYDNYNKVTTRKKEKEKKFMGLYYEKRRSDINFNNTNRSFLNLSKKLNTEKRSKNYRNSIAYIENRRISPLSKKIPISLNNSNIKKNSNINDTNISINNLKNENNNKNDINISKNKENENDIIIEDEKKINVNDNKDNINDNNNNDNSNDNNEINTNTNRSSHDISECSYMLIKNFEAFKISKEDSLTLIIKPILNEISNEKQIKNDILVNLFTNKICECINCTKNNNDIISISNVINSLLNESKYELFSFIKAFLDIFDSVKIYTDNLVDEEGIIKKINVTLCQYKEYFTNSYTKDFISFFTFRGLLNNKEIILDDESIEYLIYRMKKDCPNIAKQDEKKNINKDNNNDKNKNDEENNENKINNNNDKNKNTLLISNENNTNSIIINLNNGISTNIDQSKEIHNEDNKNEIKDNNIDIKNNGDINYNINSNSISIDECSIFDLNYKTFLNLI